jgi:hypothetical protein
MAPGELPKYRRSLSPNIVSDAKKIRNESKKRKKERKKDREQWIRVEENLYIKQLKGRQFTSFS